MVPFEPGTLTAIGYNCGIAVAEDEAVTAGAPAKIVIEPDRDYICNDGMDAVLLNFSVVDKDGNLCETADNQLHFELIGDGVLLGVGNGDPNSHESDHLPERKLFAGHAQAIVQTLPGAEKLKFRAVGEGLEAAEVTLEVRSCEIPSYLYASVSHVVRDVTVTAATYLEQPDACMTIADNDMNSFEAVSFDKYSVKPGFTDGWKIFRAFVEVPEVGGEMSELVFGGLSAALVKVYVDGTCVHDERNIEADHPVSVKFAACAGRHELRILVKADEKTPCGIRGGIELKK
jgi:beta-galactosidase